VSPATSQARPPSWQIVLAFAVIYLVWGSTYLAIRVGVQEIPPFLMAALRFLTAGALLYGWTQLRRTASPTPRQWGAAVLLSIPMFVIDYGLVFWAEQRVPSGITAVILATIPVFLSLFEIAFLDARRFTLRLGIALFLGVLGVAALVNNSPSLGGAPIDRRGLLALLVASISWSAASAFTRKFPLPASKSMSSAAQMLAGGWLLLAVAAASGELRGFHFSAVSARAWFALIYLIVPGSVVAFTTYLWLLHYESPTKVGTYAYVNPVVAVIIGAGLGGESIGLRTIAAAALILICVLLIASGGSNKRARSVQAQAIQESRAHERS
jgi:drug/metabolite transporter (DMT)-like permease